MRDSCQFQVNLNSILHNISQLKNRVQNEMICMVKANAYGHGLVPTVEHIIKNTNNRNFGVASLGEAVFLRHSLAPHQFDIFIFSDLGLEIKENMKYYEELRLSPVLSHFDDLEIFLEHFASTTQPLIIKANTGMNRLGFDLHDVEKVARLLKKYGRKEVHHLMTHFACASQTLKSDEIKHQYENFLKFKSELKACGISVNETSVSNSGAIEQKVGLEESHIRPGLILYGPSSLDDQSVIDNPWKGELAGSFMGKVLRTFPAKKGTKLSYGASILEEDAFVVLMGVGYGDGLVIQYANTNFIHQGHEGRVFGRINMDMSYMIFDPKVEGKIKRNDYIQFWSSNKELLSLAARLKTVPYELMCHISDRVKRNYIK